MKVNLTKKYLTKLTDLAAKFHKEEASMTDLVQLKLLIDAFQTYLKNNKVSPEIAYQFSEIRKLSQVN